MNKKEALQSALNGIEVIDPEGRKLHWNSLEFILDGEDFLDIYDLPEKGWNVYEPAKEEAPEHIDIEVWDDKGLSCLEYGLGDVIGKFIERHDTRYFATWYLVNGSCMMSPHNGVPQEYKTKPTYASHVRFIREDLLGGIPNE